MQYLIWKFIVCAVLTNIATNTRADSGFDLLNNLQNKVYLQNEFPQMDIETDKSLNNVNIYGPDMLVSNDDDSSNLRGRLTTTAKSFLQQLLHLKKTEDNKLQLYDINIPKLEKGINNKLLVILVPRQNNYDDSQRRYMMHSSERILGVPTRPEHLPKAMPILPGHTLLRPARGMLKSSVKYPLRDFGGLVYGNMDNLGITYGKTPYRIRYTGFRRDNFNFFKKLLNSIKNSKIYGRNHPLVIIEIDPSELQSIQENVQNQKNENEIPVDNAAEILDDSDELATSDNEPTRRDRRSANKRRSAEIGSKRDPPHHQDLVQLEDHSAKTKETSATLAHQSAQTDSNSDNMSRHLGLMKPSSNLTRHRRSVQPSGIDAFSGKTAQPNKHAVQFNAFLLRSSIKPHDLNAAHNAVQSDDPGIALQRLIFPTDILNGSLSRQRRSILTNYSAPTFSRRRRSVQPYSHRRRRDVSDFDQPQNRRSSRSRHRSRPRFRTKRHHKRRGGHRHRRRNRPRLRSAHRPRRKRYHRHHRLKYPKMRSFSRLMI